MQSFLFAAVGGVGAWLVYSAIQSRLHRREDYETDLANAEYEKKTAAFWGWDTRGAYQAINDIIERGYGSRMKRFKFEAGFWTKVIIGGAVLLVVWNIREPAEKPWSDDLGYVFMFILVGGYIGFYVGARALDKIERKISWLEKTLKEVKEERLNIQSRLDRLG
jgi:hypothetical protein